MDATLSQSSHAVLPASAWPGLVAELSAGLHSADVWCPEDLSKPLPVAEARALIGFASRTGVGERRLAVVPCADKMNAETSNALLKLLEEPPPGLFLVLLSETSRLLPTVRSRVAPLVPSAASATMVNDEPWRAAMDAYDLGDPGERREAQRLLYLYPLVHQGIRHDLLLDRPARPDSGISFR